MFAVETLYISFAKIKQEVRLLDVKTQNSQQFPIFACLGSEIRNSEITKLRESDEMRKNC